MKVNRPVEIYYKQLYDIMKNVGWGDCRNILKKYGYDDHFDISIFINKLNHSQIYRLLLELKKLVVAV